MSGWIPKRTVKEVESILCSPGSPHEQETRLVNGILQRVYKNTPPSLRQFWLATSQEHAKLTYVVFEEQRVTFGEMLQRSLRAASVLMKIYGIKKGDRVGICSRNYPDHLTAFWACHLIGAISVQVNAWSPVDVLVYCLEHTQCKVIVLDVERADILEPVVNKLGADEILVLESHEGKGVWSGMKTWKSVMENFKGDNEDVISYKNAILPEDDATILFTSGTTGLPKGVLSTQRMYLTNVLNVAAIAYRAILRRGEDLPLAKPAEPPKGVLISVPLFHVTGSTSLTMVATLLGAKIVFMRKWSLEEAVRLIKQEDLGIAGGVPSMVIDMVDNPAEGLSLEGLSFGGAPAPDVLTARATRAFPNTQLTQGYGLTETNSVATGFAGEDYLARPLSCGLPSPITDLRIIDGDREVPTGEVGEVWLKGPNIMKEYWRDPDATAKVITKDGWFKTGDLGYVDHEGFLYIRDRIKDLIIRGGENIDSVSIENALYAEIGVLEAAAVGVPHKRLGELVAAFVCLKPGYRGKVTEASLIATASKSLLKHAVPVMIIIQDEALERTPSGKVIKTGLRKVAQAAWERRAESAKL